jgi:LPS O-antigen subunit length determinant protein (WzzB/FepE family)
MNKTEFQNNRYQEDEIDLRELFETIWDKKVFIVLFTMIVTIASIVYVVLKNPTPIYQGKIYMEIGQIQNKNFVPVIIENVNDLVGILKIELKVDASILKGTTKLLEISFDNEDKKLITNKLNQVKDFIIEKHKNQSLFYENVILSKQIGNIIILDEPINKPKKRLFVTVAFVTGLILSIFIAFLLNFFREEKNKPLSA